jgi:hypothetical protein
LRIEIFSAEDESSVALDRPLRSDPKGARVPDVQETSRRRSEASAIRWRDCHKRILNLPLLGELSSCDPIGQCEG